MGLVRGVLGVWPRQPGYTECELQPRLGELEWVRGTVPVPSGAIKLELEPQKGGQIALPAQVRVKLTGYTDSSGTTVLTGPGTFSLKAN